MSLDQTPQIQCQPRMLPKERQDEAMRLAVETNQANQPTEAAIEALQAKIGTKLPRKDLLAVLTSKYFGVKGVSLTVGFMESTPDDLKQRILSHMNSWSEFSNVKFTLIDSVNRAQVRISLAGSGYWSYLGTDVLLIPRGEATMNLQGFSMRTPESEYRRVVRHETGHTLGCPHEHLRRDIIDMLDRDKVIAWGRRVLGWSRQTVIEQILTPLDDDDIMGTPGADVRSIMTYQLPGEVTVSGEPILGGLDFSSLDREFAAKIYPLKDGPVKPPADALSIEVFGTLAPGKYKLAPAGAAPLKAIAMGSPPDFLSLKPDGMSDIDWWALLKQGIDLLLAWLKKTSGGDTKETEDKRELDDKELEDVSAGGELILKLLPYLRRNRQQASRSASAPSQGMGC